MKLLNIPNIVQNIVDQITPMVQIDAFEDLGDGTFKLSTCDSYYLRPCKHITIDSEEFEIVSMVQDQELILKPQNSLFDISSIVSTSFSIYPPFFFHGTPIMINNELTMEQFASDKTPAIYLFESLRERHFEERSFSPISLEADLVVFFLDSANWSEWNTDQHYSQVIEPMKALIKEFVDVINKNRADFDELNQYEIVPRVNFGNTSSIGTLKNYFNDQFSGAELRFTLRYKKYLCENGCI